MPERIYAFVALVVIVATNLYPLRFERPRDSFPLSNYPMFARARTKPEVSLYYFVAHTTAGQRRYVAPEFVGNAEVLQARSLIHGAVRRGRAEATKLCRAVATRLATQPAYAGGSLSLVGGKHDAVEFLVRDRRGSERAITRCAIPGKAP